jgi:predicted ArsR family transcriptional regulator
MKHSTASKVLSVFQKLFSKKNICPSNQEIANVLKISNETVRVHMHKLFKQNLIHKVKFATKRMYRPK